ncbi:MAG: hypothetical protein Q9M91_07950 [Candidatus Dojkabacteria bacterium]|nr:hypothetical protein [Candidatus Dojkabacteria bacterium]
MTLFKISEAAILNETENKDDNKEVATTNSETSGNTQQVENKVNNDESVKTEDNNNVSNS